MKLQLLTILTALAVIPSTWGMTLKADIKGNTIHWDQVHQLGGNELTPSFWHVVSGLRPTAKWVPGGLSGAVSAEVRLTYGSEIAIVPLRMKGFEYNTGTASPVEGDGQTGVLCPGASFSGGIVKVTDIVGCIYPTSLVTTDAVTPYSFIRPIIEMDNADILAALDGMPAGRYVGMLPVSSFYDFYLSSVRTRHHENYQIRFEFDYEPSILTDVAISGSSELVTRYDVNGERVSADTTFTGTATGIFTNGLILSLNPTRIRYEMDGPNLSTLPYSVDCLECNMASLVDNGNVNTYETTIPASGTTVIPFNIKVSFTDVELDTLENGNYSDTFYVLFEAGI